jgi:hypothetical protein
LGIGTPLGKPGAVNVAELLSVEELLIVDGPLGEGFALGGVGVLGKANAGGSKGGTPTSGVVAIAGMGTATHSANIAKQAAVEHKLARKLFLILLVYPRCL